MFPPSAKQRSVFLFIHIFVACFDVEFIVNIVVLIGKGLCGVEMRKYEYLQNFLVRKENKKQKMRKDIVHFVQILAQRYIRFIQVYLMVVRLAYEQGLGSIPSKADAQMKNLNICSRTERYLSLSVLVGNYECEKLFIYTQFKNTSKVIFQNNAFNSFSGNKFSPVIQVTKR